MSSLAIRWLDGTTEARLRIRAARHGRSMDEEARRILIAGVRQTEERADNIADAIAAVDPIGGIELDMLPRCTIREPPRFDDGPSE